MQASGRTTEPDRTNLLVRVRRISDVFQNAINNGPYGTLEGKYASEHPLFIHYSCAFYLAGCLAYLEGEDWSYSWNKPGKNHPVHYKGTSNPDFDNFVANHPKAPKDNYYSRGINKANMNALAEVRNAVVHNNDDLLKNKSNSSNNNQTVAIVRAANLPGVTLSGSKVTLEAPFLGFVRLATLAVRNYHGEY